MFKRVKKQKTSHNTKSEVISALHKRFQKIIVDLAAKLGLDADSIIDSKCEDGIEVFNELVCQLRDSFNNTKIKRNTLEQLLTQCDKFLNDMTDFNALNENNFLLCLAGASVLMQVAQTYPNQIGQARLIKMLNMSLQLLLFFTLGVEYDDKQWALRMISIVIQNHEIGTGYVRDLKQYEHQVLKGQGNPKTYCVAECSLAELADLFSSYFECILHNDEKADVSSPSFRVGTKDSETLLLLHSLDKATTPALDETNVLINAMLRVSSQKEISSFTAVAQRNRSPIYCQSSLSSSVVGATDTSRHSPQTIMLGCSNSSSFKH